MKSFSRLSLVALILGISLSSLVDTGIPAPLVCEGADKITKDVFVVFCWDTKDEDRIMSVVKLDVERTPLFAKENIEITNIRPAWYEVTPISVGPTLVSNLPPNLTHSFILPPNGEVSLGTVKFGPGESLALSADGTANSDLVVSFLVMDLLYRLIMGSSMPQYYVDLALDEIRLVRPFSGFLLKAGKHMVEGDYDALRDDLADLPTNPTVVNVLKKLGLEIPTVQQWLPILGRLTSVARLVLETAFSPHYETLLFQTTRTSAEKSIEQALDENNNCYIDDEEIMKAVDYWISGQTVPGADGKTISDTKMMELVDMWVTQTPITGCEPTGKKYPIAIIQASPTSGEAPLLVSFDGSASSDPDGSIVKYEWEFGDGATDTGMTVIHTYQNPGVYTAKLTVTDNDGFQDSDTISIEVAEPSQLRPEILDQSVYPNTAHPGQTITFVYNINNPTSQAIPNVRLGAQIRTSEPQGSWIDDPSRDKVVTLQPGAHDYSREFKIPDSATEGFYDLNWVILNHDTGEWLDHQEMLRILKVEKEPLPEGMLFPATLIFATGPNKGPENATPYASRTVTVTRNPDEQVIISSTPDGKGNILVDNFLSINGAIPNFPSSLHLEERTGVAKIRPGVDLGCPGPANPEIIGKPIEEVLYSVEPLDITSYIPEGTSQITFALLDEGCIAGNTDLYLVKVRASTPPPYCITPPDWPSSCPSGQGFVMKTDSTENSLIKYTRIITNLEPDIWSSYDVQVDVIITAKEDIASVFIYEDIVQVETLVACGDYPCGEFHGLAKGTSAVTNSYQVLIGPAIVYYPPPRGHLLTITGTAIVTSTQGVQESLTLVSSVEIWPEDVDTSSGNYYPLAVGNRWLYSYKLDSAYGTKQYGTEEQIVGTTVVSGVATFIKETRTSYEGWSSLSKQFIVQKDDSVLLYAQEHYVNGEKTSEKVYQEPLIVLKYPLIPGQSWRNSGGGGAECRWESQSQVVSTGETVTVPAGIFTDCVKIETSMAVTCFEDEEPYITINREWLTPGIGRVRHEFSHPADIERREFVLISYQVQSESTQNLIADSVTQIGVERNITTDLEGVMAYPNPARNGMAVQFKAEGQGLKNIQLQIYDLSGKEIFNSGYINGQTIEWHLMNNQGKIVANGVYLYMVTARGYDGQVIRSKVKKLVVLR